MLRNEVEALLKLEDPRIELKIYPRPWRHGNWRVGVNELWVAYLKVHGIGIYRVAGCSTNHEAASVLYKHYIKEKHTSANN